MKKLLLFMLGLFVSLAIFGIWNTTIGQEKIPPGLSTGLSTKWGCLTWIWNWCFSFDVFIHWSGSKITSNNERRTVTTIAQDVILAATYMVWGVLTIIIIYCGLMYIFAARDGKDVSNYKKWLINAAIWAVLVRWAYAIVRLIQYIAKW